jgi:LmbE family N-acetylglucosaminyl deacetylase
VVGTVVVVSTVLVIPAHPDDESFANSGRIALLASGGHRIVGVIATGGEAGELSRTHDVEGARRRRLGKYEVALDALGAASRVWLEPGAEWVDVTDSPTVAQADPVRLRRAVERVVEKHDPHMALTVGCDGLTAHPDHLAIARAVRDVFRDQTLPGGVWGARLDRKDVDAGLHLLRHYCGDRQVGSGRVTGTDAALTVLDVSAVKVQRREALDSYSGGLGTRDLKVLIDASDRIRDSLLLRAIYDTEDWTSERYERIDTAR